MMMPMGMLWMTDEAHDDSSEHQQTWHLLWWSPWCNNDDENANDDDANGNAVNSWSEKFLPGKRELFLSLQLSPLSNGVEEEEFGEEEEEKLEMKDKAEQELSLPSLFNSFSSSQRRQGGGPWG